MMELSAQRRPPQIDGYDTEQLKHWVEMHRIADELHCPLADIAPLYVHLLVTLGNGAAVRTYLPVIIARHIRELVKQQALTDRAIQHA